MAFTIEGCIPSHQEPQGLLRTDGKRPDGLALIPWRDGRCATWDVTVTDSDTVVASYLSLTSSCASSAAEAAATRKGENIQKSPATIFFSHFAFETFGPINQGDCDFLSS